MTGLSKKDFMANTPLPAQETSARPVGQHPGVVLISALVAILFFEIYSHYWLVSLMGTNLLRLNVAPLFILLLVSIIHNLPNIFRLRVGREEINKVLFVTMLYLVFGSISLVVNEPDFHSYFIYLFTPILIYLTLLGLYKDNARIDTTLKFLFILGLIFAVYSNYLSATHALRPGHIEFEGVQYVAGGVSGAFTRQTVPGISSIEYASMLLLLVLTGLYFFRQAKGRHRHFYTAALVFLMYTLLETGTRSAMVSLAAALLYLTVKKWFTRTELFFGLLVFGGLILKTQTIIFRLLSTLTPYFSSLDGMTVFGSALTTTVFNPRLYTLGSTLSLFLGKPIFGVGFTRFIEIQTSEIPALWDPVKEELTEYSSIEHNHMWAMFGEAGAATALPYILTILAIFFLINRLMKKRRSMDTRTRNLGILMATGVIGSLIDMNFSATIYPYHWIWFGLAASWLRNTDRAFHSTCQPTT